MRIALALMAGLIAAPALAAPLTVGSAPPLGGPPPASLAEQQRREAAQAEAETRLRLQKLEAQRAEQAAQQQLAESRDKRVVRDASTAKDESDQARRAGEVDAWLAKGRTKTR